MSNFFGEVGCASTSTVTSISYKKECKMCVLNFYQKEFNANVFFFQQMLRPKIPILSEKLTLQIVDSL